MKETPAWQVSLMEMVDPYGWHDIDATMLRYVRDRLTEYEAKTWTDILITERYRNHLISVTDICRDAQKRLEAIKQSDTDDLVSLRFSSKERVWGIREGRVLKVLWWDPDHLVYPVEKKHT